MKSKVLSTRIHEGSYPEVDIDQEIHIIIWVQLP